MKKSYFLNPLIYVLFAAGLILCSSGLKGQAITNFPFVEDFNGVVVPELPEGWSSHVYNPTFTAVVETSSLSTPLSPPNQLRLYTNEEQQAFVAAITPPIENLQTKRVRFWAKCHFFNNIPDLIVGTMSDPADTTTFTAFQTFAGGTEFTNGFQQFTVVMDETIGTDQYLVFREGPTGSGGRGVLIDDLMIDENPTGPVLFVNPLSWNFEPVQINCTGEPKEFQLINDGPGLLEISPSDISISGDDASLFILENLSSAVSLASNESASVYISFSPVIVGEASASLNILDKTILLTASAYDATIVELPHLENFDQVTVPDLPLGWKSIVYNPSLSNASVQTYSNSSPYSEPNHVQLFSNNDAEAQIVLISPPVDNLETTRVRFRAKCNNTSYVPHLIVGSMSSPDDASTFHPVDTILASEQLTNNYDELFTVYLNDINEGDNYLAFRHGGTPSYTRYIFIDDILIQEIPTEPIIITDSDEFLFGQVQVNNTTNYRSLTITNDGGGILNIEPGELSFSGNNPGDFILYDVPSAVNLASGESTTVGIAFSPLSTGSKQAALQIKGVEFDVSGEGIDATITESPYVEDFDNIPNPGLPFGWTSLINNDTYPGSLVETTTSYSPFSAPNHLQISSDNNTQSFVAAISPPVNNLQGKRVRFMAKSNTSSNAPYLILGTTSNPYDQSAFSQILVLEAGTQLTTTYQEFTLIMDETIGDDQYLVFRWGATPNYIRSILIDDVIIDDVPTTPVLFTDPQQVVFPETQINTTSEPLTITLTNDGVGTLVIEPADISISGADASEFTLSNLNQAVSLGENESATINLVFNPVASGEKDAILNILDTAVPVSGVCYDPSVYALPWLEDFSGADAGSIPDGWSANCTNWSVFSHNAAGGEAPELRMNYSPSFEGIGYIQTPPIYYTGNNNLILTFDHYVNDYGSPGLYTLKVVAVAGEEEFLIHQWVDPATINAEEVTFSFSLPLSKTEDEPIYLRWLLDGTSNDINQWHVDNVLLEEAPELYSLTFNVVGPDGIAVTDAVVSLNDQVNEAGNYIFSGLPEGTYSYSIEAEHFETLTAEVFVDSNIIVDAALSASEYVITFNVEDADGNNIGDAVITLGDIANEPGDYVFEGITAGIYDYSVGAPGFVNQNVQAYEVTGDASIDVILDFETYNVSFIVKDTGNNPLPNAVITLGDHVNEAGNYVFESVRAGNYSYSVAAPGFITLNETDFMIDQDVEINVQLIPVTFTINFSVGDQEGNAINDAIITFNGIENPAGDYVFTGIVEGTYDYSVVADGYITQIAEDFVVDQDSSILVVLDEQVYTVAFNVADQQGNPLDNAVITFADIVNDPGDYVFEGISAGFYDYSVEAEGYHLLEVDDFEVTSDVTVDVSLTLITYTVLFEVKDDQNQAIENAVITFGGTSNPAGEYEFVNIIPGNYDYEVYAQGFETVVFEGLEVDENVTVSVQMVAIIPVFNLSFQITDEDGNTINNAVITLNEVAYGPGEYYFEELEAGTYSYLVAADGYLDAEGQAEIINEDVTVQVSLENDDVSAETLEISTIQVYPNPAHDRLNIISIDNINKVNIIDLTGQIVYSGQFDTVAVSVDVSGLKNGFYLLQLISDSKITVHSIQILN